MKLISASGDTRFERLLHSHEEVVGHFRFLAFQCVLFCSVCKIVYNRYVSSLPISSQYVNRGFSWVFIACMSGQPNGHLDCSHSVNSGGQLNVIRHSRHPPSVNRNPSSVFRQQQACGATATPNVGYFGLPFDRLPLPEAVGRLCDHIDVMDSRWFRSNLEH